jgi:mycoredoxin-dependent peroxiredoxin
LKAYQADIAKFEASDTQVLGISVDSSPANAHFGQEIGVTFPLLSDFARRQVVKDYGIFMEQTGFGTRATFVVDKEGRIRHIEQGRTAVDPSGAYEACNILSRPKATP